MKSQTIIQVMFKKSPKTKQFDMFSSPSGQLCEREGRLYDGIVSVRDKRKISAKSVQNPNEPDAEYRGKNKQRVKGFVTNITETVPEDGKPSLVTDVKVKGATAAFFEEAVKETEKVTGDDVENAYVDGAYQSETNREFAKDKINIISGGLQGKPSRFDLNLKDDIRSHGQDHRRNQDCNPGKTG